MWLAIPAQERPARNALTVVVSCVNPTRKPVADATRSSARPVFSFIERSTQNLHMGNVESEKELRGLVTKPRPFRIEERLQRSHELD